ADEDLRRETGEGFHIAGEVRLVGVPGDHGDVGERQAGAGVVEGDVHPQDSVEHLRAVAERVQAAAVQLPLAQADRAGQAGEAGAAPGASRIPAYRVPLGALPVQAWLSGPATKRSSSMSSRSMQPSGRIRNSPPSAVRVHRSAPAMRAGRSRYGSTTMPSIW